MSTTALAATITDDTAGGPTPNRNWRSALVPGELSLRDLLTAATMHLLPRAKTPGPDVQEEIAALKAALDTSGGNFAAIPAPIVHAGTNRLLDGGTAIVPAITGWIHATTPSASAAIVVPVLYHMGTLVQAVTDVMESDVTSAIKRTGSDRVRALRSFLEALAGDAPPSANALASMFSIHKRVALDVRSEICGRGGDSVGLDGKSYRAARDLVDAAAASRMALHANVRPASTTSDDIDAVRPDRPDESGGPSDAWIAAGETASETPTAVLPDLEPYARAEAVAADLLRAIRTFRDLVEADSDRETGLVARLSDQTFGEVRTQISALNTLWRFAARRD